eukprot:125293-Chlamydomonas_euryale.AAC.2
MQHTPRHTHTATPALHRTCTAPHLFRHKCPATPALRHTCTAPHPHCATPALRHTRAAPHPRCATPALHLELRVAALDQLAQLLDGRRMLGRRLERDELHRAHQRLGHAHQRLRLLDSVLGVHVERERLLRYSAAVQRGATAPTASAQPCAARRMHR